MSKTNKVHVRNLDRREPMLLTFAFTCHLLFISLKEYFPHTWTSPIPLGGFKC